MIPSLFRTHSSRQLILTGFFLLALLLIVGQITAVISVDSLARQGRLWIDDAVATLQLSQSLGTEIVSLERAARQYHVIRDDSLYQVYLERRARLQQVLNRLSAQSLSDAQRQRLTALRTEELRLFEALSPPGNSVAGRVALERMTEIDGHARAIVAESGMRVRVASERIHNTAAATKRQLVIQALALVPAALMLAAIYSVLIHRPIRQMASAIRSLGNGKFVEPLRVTGPRDFEELGKQLDWLRLQLRALEQHKVTILRNISHELKTPLAAIREGVELLHDEVPGTLNRQQAEIARILQANSLRLHKLIEDLINFSVAQTEDPFLTDRPVQLHRLLYRVLDEQRPLTLARQVRLRGELTEATVVGDQEKLKSIFDNLLSNAIKYSPDGGEIQISLKRTDGSAVIDVCDQGPGIDSSERRKVFDAFYQGRAPAKGQIKGSGLGLSIAHAYTRLHRGTIEVVESARGAHLRVALPLAGTGNAI